MAMNSVGYFRLKIFSTNPQHFLFLIFLLDQSDQHIIIPGIPNSFHSLDGDIILAGLFPIGTYDKSMPCGPEAKPSIKTAVIQSMVFAIEKINEDPKLLPGIKLGLVLLDTCDKEETAIAQAIRLVPRSSPASYTKSSNPSHMQSYKAHAVVIGHQGKIAMSASFVLGSTNIASVSFITGFPELDYDKRRKYKDIMECTQTKIILHLIQSQQWQDVVLVYDTGEFGKSCGRQFKEMAVRDNICIGATTEIEDDVSLDDVIEKLYYRLTSDVAVFLGQMETYSNLAFAIDANDVINEIIWIIALPQTAFFMTHTRFVKNMFPGLHYLITRASPPVPDFLKHLEYTDHRFYTAIHGKPGCPKNQCNLSESLSEMGNGTDLFAEMYDSVFIYAYAIHSLLTKRCPGAKGAKADQCMQKYGKELKRESMKVKFHGLSGNVSFDSYGHRLTNFDILKIDSYYNGSMEEGIVGMYNYHAGEIKFTHNISIAGHKLIHRKLQRRRFRCERSCAMGEIRDYTGECCFKCIKCDKNEITKKGQCKKCPTLKWPDPATNLTKCADIEPTSMSYSPFIIILLTLGQVGAGISIATLMVYISERKHRLIKASSIELSVLQLLSVLAGFVDIDLWFAEPTPAKCRVAMMLFHSSFNVLYAAMLVKAIRVYRIFTTISSLRRLKYTSPLTQVSLTLLIATVQLVACFLIELNYPISTARHMPVWDEKLVELTCSLPRIIMLSFISLNTLILSLCGLYAYKTKTLPDDFNESRYMSMCIYTTIVIWAAFMPVWLIFMNSQFLQGYIMAMVILLNHGTALVFLFLPKVFTVLALSWWPYRDETVAKIATKPTTEIETTPTGTVDGVHSSGVN